VATYLLTWNPSNGPWHELNREIEKINKDGYAEIRWSCGNTKRIRVDDRVFLMCQGKKSKYGIIGDGIVVSEPSEGIHWNAAKAEKNILAKYVDVQFFRLLNPETDEVLQKTVLEKSSLSVMNWGPRASGVQIPDNIALELEAIWSEFLGNGDSLYSGELPGSQSLWEGAKKSILVNRYERSTKSRQKCIEYHGTNCSVCKMSFSQVYGKIGKGYTQVHHLLPLSQMNNEYEINPARDLVPVCPNCHAMIHKRNPPFSIKEIEYFLKKNRRKK